MGQTQHVNQELSLIIEERHGIARQHEPVSVGIPFPQRLLQRCADLTMLDPQGQLIPFQPQVLATWPDHSLKWVLFDFQATVDAHTTVHYGICYDHPEAFKSMPDQDITGVTVQQRTDAIVVNTGVAEFVLDTKVFSPFRQIVVDEMEVLDAAQSGMELIDEQGRSYVPQITRTILETDGPLRTTIRFEGDLTLRAENPSESECFALFFARLHFYANSPVAKLEFTLRNPRAAQHPGGLWDLGDEGSILFEDLSLHFTLASADTPRIEWTTQPERALTQNESAHLTIYQDSSGGTHWDHRNHVNRFGKVMHQFCGYRVTSGEELLEAGKRANPIVAIGDHEKRITGTVQRFWENFPTALEVDGQTLIFRLFPTHSNDLFELQGGEQKTHMLFLSADRASGDLSTLNWIQHPLIPHATPQWYAQTKAFPYLIPYADDPHHEVLALIATAIEGEQSFVNRREIIDEYGWRNFGDLYADHEAVYYKGEGAPVSHYNNQYDCIYAQILQYVRSGDPRWFVPMHDLAHHVIDIDIYHTDQDKAAYNGGLFWHTFHYVDAETATHRAYSRKTMEREGLTVYGGGHSNEHNYATGLMYHYWLTGEPASKEAATGLAEWVMAMDDGTKTRFRWLNTRSTGAASMTAQRDYHGPGRGAAYSINTLLDAYLLTTQRPYLAKAEELLQRCIHPQDDLEQRNLLNTELRWSYTVFLQVLGRYLDLKVELGETDDLFCYARESLLQYARWMQAHERCISTVFDTVEYPTETWPGQDLRKNHVFLFAAKYSQEPLRSEFLERAAFFWEHPLRDLFAFETKTLTRPLILLMLMSPMPAYFERHPDEAAPQCDCPADFGEPQPFVPQLYTLEKFRTAVFTVRER
ncbi:hypothetical protein GF339_05265, partial [candidate division KSB3 bacterium]|nr:hypothetical protein [candidate division KSB3 bacterium]MBD3323971.1 hypothetical protein [candidate division KSB3 bacterium]